MDVLVVSLDAVLILLEDREARFSTANEMGLSQPKLWL